MAAVLELTSINYAVLQNGLPMLSGTVMLKVIKSKKPISNLAVIYF